MLKTLSITKSSVIYVLLIFAPIAIGLEYLHVDHLILFAIAIIALIPLAKLIGDSTEHLATHYGATLGSLLNVTFGNAAEIIISVIALNAGLLELVKASITGSILGNIMLIFGLSLIAGGLPDLNRTGGAESLWVVSFSALAFANHRTAGAREVIQVKAAHSQAPMDEMPEDQICSNHEATHNLALKAEIDVLRGPTWNVGRKQYVGSAGCLFQDLDRL